MQRERGHADVVLPERHPVDAVEGAVQLTNELAEEGVARGLINGEMEGGISIAPRLARIERVHQFIISGADLAALLIGRVQGRLTHHRHLQRPAHLGGAQQCNALKLQIERDVEGVRIHLGHQIGSRALAAADNAKTFPAPERFSDGGATDAKALGQGGFGGDKVANDEPCLLNHGGERISTAVLRVWLMMGLRKDAASAALPLELWLRPDFLPERSAKSTRPFGTD